MFFLIPVGMDYVADRPPLVTYALLLLNAAFYAIGAVLFFMHEGVDPLIRLLGMVPAHPRLFTLFSHQFIHGDFFHFLGNMVYLFLFGACVEDRVGRLPFAVFYLVCGALAAGTQILFSTVLDANIPMVGASGAIAGCMGAFAVAMPKTKIEVRYFGWFLRFFSGEFWASAWILVGLWFLDDLWSLVSSLGRPHEGGGVAFAAHLGGMATGAVGVLLLRRKSEPETISPVAIADDAFESGPIEPASIFLFVEGREIGPFTTARVRGMLRHRSIPNDSQFWREGMEAWRPVSEL